MAQIRNRVLAHQPEPGGSTGARSARKPAARHKIFIVAAHPVLRRSLAQIFKGQKARIICGRADTARAAVSGIRKSRPDLVLLDHSLVAGSRSQMIQEIRGEDPGTKVLVISKHDDASQANRVLRAGVEGYILIEEGPEEILSAVNDVLAGRVYVSERVLANSVPHSSGRGGTKAGGGAAASEGKPTGPSARSPGGGAFTPRELQILESLGRGQSNQEIAHRVGARVREVAAACAQLREKLKLGNANALVRYAVLWVEGRS